MLYQFEDFLFQIKINENIFFKNHYSTPQT